MFNYKMVDSFYLCIACTILKKKRRDKKKLSLQQILYGLRGGLFGGLLQGENLERDSTQKRKYAHNGREGHEKQETQKKTQHI
jgi:hypothetical protein